MALLPQDVPLPPRPPPTAPWHPGLGAPASGPNPKPQDLVSPLPLLAERRPLLHHCRRAPGSTSALKALHGAQAPTEGLLRGPLAALAQLRLCPGKLGMLRPRALCPTTRQEGAGLEETSWRWVRSPPSPVVSC